MTELEVQIRMPIDPADSAWLVELDEMVVTMGETLESQEAGFVDDAEEEGPEICFYAYGPDQDRVIAIARGVLADFGRLERAYAVKTAPGSEDTGEGVRVSFEP